MQPHTDTTNRQTYRKYSTRHRKTAERQKKIFTQVLEINYTNYLIKMCLAFKHPQIVSQTRFVYIDNCPFIFFFCLFYILCILLDFTHFFHHFSLPFSLALYSYYLFICDSRLFFSISSFFVPKLFFHWNIFFLLIW